MNETNERLFPLSLLGFTILWIALSLFGVVGSKATSSLDYDSSGVIERMGPDWEPEETWEVADLYFSVKPSRDRIMGFELRSELIGADECGEDGPPEIFLKGTFIDEVDPRAAVFSPSSLAGHVLRVETPEFVERSFKDPYDWIPRTECPYGGRGLLVAAGGPSPTMRVLSVDSPLVTLEFDITTLHLVWSGAGTLGECKTAPTKGSTSSRW